MLNRAFVAQSGVPPLVVEEENILIQEGRDILGAVEIEVKIEFFLHYNYALFKTISVRFTFHIKIHSDMTFNGVDFKVFAIH